MIPFRLATLLVLSALSSGAPILAQSRASFDAEDARVYKAVLEHTVRTFVVSFSNRMDAPPPPLLVLDVTMTWCPTDGGALTACLERDRVESAAQSIPAPPELTASFGNRNASRVELPGNLAPDSVSIPHDAVPDALRAWHEQAFGYLAFSLPGYSGDRALVWVSYMCDSCGRGWMFTLHREGGGWAVDDVRRSFLNR